MSRNKLNQQLLVHDSIKNVLSSSMYLEQNKEAVVQYALPISKKALGIDNCNKFKIISSCDGPINYGTFTNIYIDSFAFEYDENICAKDNILLIPKFSWCVFVPGFREKRFEKRAVPEWTIEDFDDFLCIVSLSYNPSTKEFVHIVQFDEDDFKILPHNENRI